jgi:uncharacterized protein
MWLADLFGSSRVRRFFDLLVQHAALLAQAARTLRDYVLTGDADLADKIAKLELRGDVVLAELVNAIRDSFVTPLDRQDLYNLGETIDDMIDYLNNAAVEFKLFCIAPTGPMHVMCGILVDAANQVEAAVIAISKDANAAIGHANTACACENRMEDVYREALAELFDGEDIRAMLKVREIYRHLSNSADRADAVGKLIGKIVVKNL